MPRAPFAVEEATVRSIHEAFAEGRLNCVELVRRYLERIDAYDRRGPSFNAVLHVNPRAIEHAAATDCVLAASGPTLPLHGVPIVLKDNYDTADMPTTGGSITLRHSIPPDDACVVTRLKAAGAVIVAKTNLTELARIGTTVSSLGGQTKNPYDLTRTAGGSSGGTGAAVAANLALLGTGSDTGQSIRSPASATCLVGLRPTRGLVSRDGIMPLSPTQDEAGPMTRTVEDAARMLDVMAGYDAADPITAACAGNVPHTYLATLDADGLRGARIGLLVDVLGHQAIHEPVNAIVQAAVATMIAGDATVMPIGIPDFHALTHDLSLMTLEFQVAFNRYLASLGASAPVSSFADFVFRGEFHESLRSTFEGDRAIADGTMLPEYQEQVRRRTRLRHAVLTAIERDSLDAILYPHQQRLVVPLGEDQVERNGVLSNSTGCPALTFPGGFSAPTADAPLGVPVGLELLGPEWSEPKLFRLAYAFEQKARVRRPPLSAPELG